MAKRISCFTAFLASPFIGGRLLPAQMLMDTSVKRVHTAAFEVSYESAIQIQS
ncbi:hypothetical protein SAMN04490202_0662 [Pseudomonas reinekei]|uniref:Uncharacterized protein n=1 Tax=Pseudomonas reinekei TaxID=395598 RepID=A0A1H0IVU6_PSERE|nr:hypothetical protein [Pseudomonas reinekei]SDO35654.1 hypothetical protein SAMN04490202_0662 [Pseudomonas reinekei]